MTKRMKTAVIIIGSALFLSGGMVVFASEVRVHEPPVLRVEPTTTGPLTLSQCYNYALRQSEIVAIDAQLIKETEAQFLQALGTMLPHISYGVVHGQDDYKDEDAPFNVKYSNGQFTFTQRLFTGFKEYAAMQAAGCAKRARTYDKKRAEQLLLVDVSNAFYLYAEKREDLKAVEHIRRALKERVRYLRERERLGRSRRSEVVNANAALYNVEAEIENVNSQIGVVRHLLEFLTGVPVNDIVYASEFEYPVMAERLYVQKVGQRPDVQALREDWNVARQGEVVANSGFLPKVSFVGDYYTQASGLDENLRADVMLVIDVPIFEGTVVAGDVFQAIAKTRESELSFSRGKRLAIRDIRDAYQVMQSDIVVYGALKKAYNAARLNYYLQKKDYSLSLVNNLDVLAAIQTLNDTSRNFIHAAFEAKRVWWRLLASVGEATPDRIR